MKKIIFCFFCIATIVFAAEPKKIADTVSEAISKPVNTASEAISKPANTASITQIDLAQEKFPKTADIFSSSYFELLKNSNSYIDTIVYIVEKDKTYTAFFHSKDNGKIKREIIIGSKSEKINGRKYKFVVEKEGILVEDVENNISYLKKKGDSL